MPELSEETKNKIESLSLGDMAYEINLGNRSRFQREKFAYLKACYESRLREEKLKNNISHINQTETRDEQYLRILTSGIHGESDYEAVKYLKDKGYTDSPIRLSKNRETHGKVINVVWSGPNSNGIDFIDKLRDRIESDNSNFNQNNKTDDSANNPVKQSHQESFKSSWVTIAEGVAIIVVAAMVFYLIHNHFGISLN